MERVCRVCGRSYRGLVCHACHPRGSGARAGLQQLAIADCGREPENEAASHNDNAMDAGAGAAAPQAVKEVKAKHTVRDQFGGGG